MEKEGKACSWPGGQCSPGTIGKLSEAWQGELHSPWGRSLLIQHRCSLREGAGDFFKEQGEADKSAFSGGLTPPRILSTHRPYPGSGIMPFPVSPYGTVKADEYTTVCLASCLRSSQIAFPHPGHGVQRCLVTVQWQSKKARFSQRLSLCLNMYCQGCSQPEGGSQTLTLVPQCFLSLKQS